MLNILCGVGQAAEGKFHLVLVCFAARRIHRICKKAIDLEQRRCLLGLAWQGPLGKKVGVFWKQVEMKKRGGSPPKHFLWLLLQAGIGRVARTAGQAGEWSLEVSRNEEARGIPAQTVSVLFVAGRDWMRCKEVT